MWTTGWREKILSSLNQPFDLIVIGGGITGGGVFLEAARAGMKTLLVEAHDFASGTSSRSSKLVHGGFRYLRNGQIKLTFESVRERERLLKECRGLINQLGFIIASYRGDRIPTWALGLGLTFYDLLALKWGHQYYPGKELKDLCPPLNSNGLHGGYRYLDALTDDARLVIRIIQEGVKNGGLAINYARVVNILRTNSGEVHGIQIQDMDPDGNDQFIDVQAKAVVNATGAWADQVQQLGTPPSSDTTRRKIQIRRIRGSHLVFPAHKLSLNRAVSIWHPRNKRPVFTFPWEGVTLIGTTDVDHPSMMETNPNISLEEVEDLMEAINFTFPEAGLSKSDIQSTFSGIRAVLDTGKIDPSRASREHMLLYENRMLTITGGKLTTFRMMAHQALKILQKKIADLHISTPKGPMFEDNEPGHINELIPDKRKLIRLIGRYGRDAEKIINNVDETSLAYIGSSLNSWAEVRWAARAEGVIHLDDLLLRRVRVGLVLPCKGVSIRDEIKRIVIEELGWNQDRWNSEYANYKHLLAQSYSANSTPH